MPFASLRRFFYQLHLWLGVVSGLILFVVCLSGSLYVFREEVRRAVAPEQFYVEASAEQRLSADELVAKVEAAKPGKKVGSLTLPESPTRTVAVVLNDAPKKDEKGPKGEGQREGKGGEKGGAKPEKGGEKAGQKPQDAGKGGGKPQGGKPRGEMIYVNPYTGEIVGDGKTSVDEFFGFLMKLHRWLCLPTEIGRPIVGVATIIYVVISLSGLILWLPRTAAAWRRKSTWKLALNVRFRRGGWPLVFDAHNALGFYTLLPALILALTGLCWSFGWYRDAAGSLLGEAPFKAKTEKPEEISLPDGPTHPASLEDLIAKHNRLDPGAGDVAISLPQDPETTATTIQKGRVGGFFALNVKNKTQWNRPDGTVVSVERYGKTVEVERFADKPFGAKIASSIRGLHLGEITGLSSKILAFLVCLIATSFPATGVALWIHKLRARDKKDEAQADGATAEETSEATA